MGENLKINDYWRPYNTTENYGFAINFDTFSIRFIATSVIELLDEIKTAPVEELKT